MWPLKKFPFSFLLSLSSAYVCVCHTQKCMCTHNFLGVSVRLSWDSDQLQPSFIHAAKCIKAHSRPHKEKAGTSHWDKPESQNCQKNKQPNRGLCTVSLWRYCYSILKIHRDSTLVLLKHSMSTWPTQATEKGHAGSFWYTHTFEELILFWRSDPWCLSWAHTSCSSHQSTSDSPTLDPQLIQTYTQLLHAWANGEGQWWTHQSRGLSKILTSSAM